MPFDICVCYVLQGQTTEERKIERAEKEKTLIRKVYSRAGYGVLLTAVLIKLIIEHIPWSFSGCSFNRYSASCLVSYVEVLVHEYLGVSHPYTLGRNCIIFFIIDIVSNVIVKNTQPHTQFHAMIFSILTRSGSSNIPG